MPGKGETTRERILETAIALFGEKGYTQTTMREIAQVAGCSLGLAYRYFETKDSLVLALYERMVDEFVAEVDALPSESLARRWARAERADLARLTPHRETLSGLFSAGLSPTSPVQVLGETTRPLRRRMLALFGRLVVGAKDAPKESLRAPLTTLFYAAHLLLVLFWLQDRTPGQRATDALVDFGEEMIGRMGLLLKLPWVTPSLVRLAGILGPLFGDD